MAATETENASLETVVIDRVVAGGDGLARQDDGLVTLVAGGLPGERVRVRITDRRSSFARGDAVEVLEPSPDRVAPPCPHVARGCGGCGWQHVAPEAQLRLKVDIVRDALRRIGRVEHPEPVVAPPLPAEGFRTTVRVAVVDGRAGFRHARSHDTVTVDSCLVAHPLVDEVLATGRFGSAIEATVRCGVATGERLALLDPTADGDVELPGDVAAAGIADLRRGAHLAIHEVVDGHRFRVSARSFFQARPDGAAALVDAVRAVVADALSTKASTLVDLYAGVGLFAATAGRPAHQVVAVESNRSAIADARHNLGGRRASVVRADVGRWRPLPATAVVADPARTGLGKGVAERIAATGADKVALVGCDPASFARDAAALVRHGYSLDAVTLVDIFPHTPHVEVVGDFTSSGSASGAV